MMKNEQRKVVVVTGASAGVGRAVVREFAKEGAAVALLARSEDRLSEAAQEVESLGGRALIIPTDTSDFAQVSQAADMVENKLGPIDIWVNNAMVSIVSPFQDIKPDEYKRITDVTYLGYVWGTMVALNKMLPRNRGTIVQVGSALAHRSIPLQSAYCGAKHAIQGFTISVRCELLHKKSKVHVTLVHLPGVNTPQFNWVRNRFTHKPSPVGAVFQPEVAAEAIVWASKNKRREVFVGYPTLESVWGNRIAPALLDRYIAKMVYKHNFTSEIDPPNREDNLFTTPAADYAAHGPFDEKAKGISLQFHLSKHRWLYGIGTLACAAIGYSKWKHMQPSRPMVDVNRLASVNI